jgi:ribonuclease P protein component
MFTVLYRPNGGDQPRLGLAISKKHCRQATSRNRLKRVIRESFRHHREVIGGLDVVVMNQPGTAVAGNAALFESLDRHWQRIGNPDASAEQATKLGNNG